MGLKVLYENVKDASTSTGVGYLDISDRVRAYTFDVSQSAEEGSVSMSQITVDDPDGDLDIVGWRRMFAFETTATSSNTHIFGGWVADKTIHRGPFRTEAGRVWDVSVADDNSLLEMRILNTPGANRPAETDVQRIQWLTGTPEFSRYGDVTTYVNTSNAKAMDAVDYHGQKMSDVVSDCAQQSGKNYFTFLIEGAAGGLQSLGTAFWYGYQDSTLYTSPLRLTNDLADIDNTWTFAIAEDTKLVRDPSRTFSGVYLEYDGGDVYEELASTSINFTRRDVNMSSNNVKSRTKATARAIRYLNDLDEEEDRITTAVYLPAAKIGFLKVGMRVQIKATHLPGYQTVYRYLRVLKRQVLMTSEGSESSWLVTLELGTGPSTPVVGGSCSSVGGTLIIHTLDHPDIPHGNATYAIYTGATWANVDAEGPKVTGIAPGDYTYNVPAGKCCIVLKGESGGLGVPYNGITWNGTYIPENGDGLGGHTTWYGNATPDDDADLLGISLWSFPEYQRTVVGGVADYGLGLNNIVAFHLP